MIYAGILRPEEAVAWLQLPNGSTLELLTGGKVVMEAGDAIRIDCSVADKLSGSLSVLEIT